jgi:hypothetical protein
MRLNDEACKLIHLSHAIGLPDDNEPLRDLKIVYLGNYAFIFQLRQSNRQPSICNHFVQ